ncbi:lipid IV(A) 3-deoxy-D-manno-octulosonic acid transferase [Vibrio cholerae]
MSLMRILYTLLLALASPLLLWGLYRKRPNKPEFGSRWKEHFGFTPPLAEDETSLSSGVIWVHAVSVGEVLASQKLVLTLKQHYPSKRILVTTTTSTGAEQVAKMGVEHRYMPIDFGWCVNRFLTTIQPDIMLIIETELWPNTISAVSQRQIPIVLVNGRLSEKSFNNYKSLSWLMRPIFRRLNQVLAIHDDDNERFLKLGVGNARATGSLKYDVTVPDDVKMKSEQLREQLGLHRRVFIAASTHQGEDEIVIQAFKKTKETVPELLLILVPRHPERFDDIASLVETSELNLVRRSRSKQLGHLASNIDVYLGDSMGEMLLLMGASDLVFMGGSLIGKKVGGHNFIEPALLKKPIITGPSYYNFKDIAEQLTQAKALTVVECEEALCSAIQDYCSMPQTFDLFAEQGQNIVKKNKGSLERVLRECDQLIP